MFMFFYGKTSPGNCGKDENCCWKYTKLLLVEVAEWLGWFHEKRRTDLFPKCVPAVCPKVMSFCGLFASLTPRRTGIFTSSVELVESRRRKEAQMNYCSPRSTKQACGKCG